MYWWQVVVLVAIGFLLSRVYILSGVYNAFVQLPFMSNKITVTVTLFVLFSIYVLVIFLPIKRVVDNATANQHIKENA